ncbi:MAG: hypothetical protein FWG68_04820 [Defluviitaleaceae bacterium]|nr:hypothetical protein [Defluviitaleaceae bacterium]
MLKVEDRVLTSSHEIGSQYPDKFMVFQYLDEDDYMDPGYLLYICDTLDEAFSVTRETRKTLENVGVVEGNGWWSVL